MPRRVWRPQAPEPTHSSNSSSLPPRTTWAWGEPDVEQSAAPRPRTASVDTFASITRTLQSEPLRRAQTAPGTRHVSNSSPFQSTALPSDEPPSFSSSIWASGGLDRVRRQLLELAVDRLRGQPLRQVALQVAKRSREQQQQQQQQRATTATLCVDPATFSSFADLVERTFPGSGSEEGHDEGGYLARGRSAGRRRMSRGSNKSPDGDRTRVDALLDVYLQSTTGGVLNPILNSYGCSPALTLAVLACAVGYDAALPSVSRRLSVNYAVALPTSSFSNTPKKDEFPGLKMLFKLVDSSGLISHLKPLDQEVFRRTVTKLLTSVKPERGCLCSQFVESLHSLNRHHMLMSA